MVWLSPKRCNGHACLAFPDGPWTVTLVNSWLGPNVYRGVGWSEIEPFIAERLGLNIGENWADCEGLAAATERLYDRLRKQQNGFDGGTKTGAKEEAQLHLSDRGYAASDGDDGFGGSCGR